MCPGPHSQGLLGPDPIDRAGAAKTGQAPSGYKSQVSEISECSHRGPPSSRSSWCAWDGWGENRPLPSERDKRTTIAYYKLGNRY